MKIRLTTIYAGPDGSFSPGNYDNTTMPLKTMLALVESGSAKRLDVEPVREAAAITPKETKPIKPKETATNKPKETKVHKPAKPKQI